MARLGDMGKVITGNTPKTSENRNYESNDICFVKPSDIADSEITRLTTSEFYISEFAREKSRILPPESILVTCIGIIGKVAINKVECAFNQQINAIIPNPQKCVANYLAYAIQAKRQVMQDIANAPIVPILNKTEFSNIEIIIPPIAHQQYIANVLDKISDLIVLRKQQLAKLDELVRSRFIERFGNPIYNSNGLPTKKLGELGSLDRGRSQHRPRNAPELLNGPYPLIQTGDVTNAELFITEYHSTYSEMGLRQSKMWKTGTLCITIAANIAQTAILTFDACFPDSVVGFIPHDDVSAIYMHYWFSFFQKILDEQAPQVAQKNINLKILSDLDVIVPPREVQEAFIAFVDQIEKARLTIRQGLDKLETLKKALMQQYFG